MSLPGESNYWRVALETRDRDGVPYLRAFTRIAGETREAAIDYVLERIMGTRAGERALMDGWRVIAAWTAPEDAVETVEVEPIDQPAFKRAAR